MSKTILHIDDEADIRELVAAYLGTKGYRVISAASRAEAIKAVALETPQLVICDLQLDESDGLQTIDQIKSKVPDVPVILFTGVLFDQGIAATVSPQSVNAYVAKTGPLTGLLQEVRRLVG